MRTTMLSTRAPSVSKLPQSRALQDPLQRHSLSSPLAGRTLASRAVGAAVQKPIQGRWGDFLNRGTAIGTVAGGILGSMFPVVGTSIGATAGGLIGSWLGAPPTYSNAHKDQYQSELTKYQEFQKLRVNAKNAYESGEIVEYSTSTANKIQEILEIGKAIYVYTVDGKLRVSGHHDPIKHAILAGNKDVYAAGTASAIGTETKRFEQIQLAIKDRDQAIENMSGLRSGSSQREVFQQQVVQYQKELEELGVSKDAKFDDYAEIPKLSKKNTLLNIDEDSGHYHPGYSSGHKAVEAWRKAGYTNVVWKPRHQKQGLLQSAVT